MAAIILAYQSPDDLIENTCLHDLSTGKGFAIFNHSFAIIMGLLSGVVYVYAWKNMKVAKD